MKGQNHQTKTTRNKIRKCQNGLSGQVYFLSRNAQYLKKPLGDVAGLTKLDFYLIKVPIGSASCAFDRHICEDECIYILEGFRTVRNGETALQVEAGDFTACPAGSEAHDLCNTELNILKCTVVGQRLDFDIVDYSEQARRLDRANGDIVDMAMIVPRQ